MFKDISLLHRQPQVRCKSFSRYVLCRKCFMTVLTYFTQIFNVFTPWKRLKTRFSKVFRRYKYGRLAWNELEILHNNFWFKLVKTFFESRFFPMEIVNKGLRTNWIDYSNFVWANWLLIFWKHMNLPRTVKICKILLKQAMSQYVYGLNDFF